VRRPKKYSWQPAIECLEDRVVPSTLINFDDVSSGTVINNHYSGVTFSLLPGPANPTATNVVAVSDQFAFSSPNVVGPQITGFNSFFDEEEGIIQAQFANPQNTVSVEAAVVTSPEGLGTILDNVYLKAYDANNNLLTTAWYPIDPNNYNDQPYQTLTVSTTGNNIAYVRFSSTDGDQGPPIYGEFDNLQYATVQPVASSLQITAPASAAAGTPCNLTVTCLDQFGNPFPGYTGTVHFTSTDPAAVLPADYTFTAADAGSHAFSAVLNTLGARTITAADSANGFQVTSPPVTVVPGPATHFRVSTSAATSTAGTAVSLTVTALDVDNNVATAYTGTVHLSSTDPKAALPVAYAFTAKDQGTHKFNVTLKTAGPQTVTVSGTDLPAGAVGYWRAEGNAQDSVGGNNGTLQGGATFAAGEVGQAFRFNGTTGYVSVPDAPSLDLTAAVTLEAWINPASLAFPSNFGTVVAKSNYPNRNYGLWVFRDGSLHLSYVNSSGVNVAFNSAPGLIHVGVFTHVAGVIDTAAGVMQIYVNGQLVASQATAGPMVPNTDPLTIGAADAGPTNFFNGLIDEVGVFNRALSAAEIQDLYFTGLPGGAVSSWQGEGNALDSAGGNSGTLQGGVTFAPGEAGQAFNFNGTTAEVSVPYSPSLALNAFTVSAWVNLGATPGSFGILGTRFGGEYTFDVKVWGNKVHGDVGNGSSWISTSVDYPATLTPGTWHLITYVIDNAAKQFALYLDSALQTIIPFSGTPVLMTPGETLEIGQDYPGEYFNGRIDEVRIYSRALAATEVQGIYLNGSVGEFQTSTGSAAVTVNPAAARMLRITGLPATATAGTAVSFTVTALDAYGNVATGYRGTVHFSSTDLKAVLPANYAFTPTDAGTHTFTNKLTFKTAGTQTVTVKDTVAATITGKATEKVVAGAATHFVLTAPATATAGVAFTVTVTAEDAYGNTATGYRGTVQFTCTDSAATLPKDYTFTAASNGKHSFSVTLRTKGKQTLTVKDLADSSIEGMATITV
jgi:hypothetical protein